MSPLYTLPEQSGHDNVLPITSNVLYVHDNDDELGTEESQAECIETTPQ